MRNHSARSMSSFRAWPLQCYEVCSSSLGPVQAREQQAGVVNIRSDDDLEPDELLGQFSSRDAEKVCCPAGAYRANERGRG